MAISTIQLTKNITALVTAQAHLKDAQDKLAKAKNKRGISNDAKAQLVADAKAAVDKAQADVEAAQRLVDAETAKIDKQQAIDSLGTESEPEPEPTDEDFSTAKTEELPKAEEQQLAASTTHSEAAALAAAMEQVLGDPAAAAGNAGLAAVYATLEEGNRRRHTQVVQAISDTADALEDCTKQSAKQTVIDVNEHVDAKTKELSNKIGSINTGGLSAAAFVVAIIVALVVGLLLSFSAGESALISVAAGVGIGAVVLLIASFISGSKKEV